jgi:hypothetical protein
MGYLASVLLKALDQRLEDRLAHLQAVICGKGETESQTFEFRPAKESHNEESSLSCSIPFSPISAPPLEGTLKGDISNVVQRCNYLQLLAD